MAIAETLIRVLMVVVSCFLATAAIHDNDYNRYYPRQDINRYNRYNPRQDFNSYNRYNPIRYNPRRDFDRFYNGGYNNGGYYYNGQFQDPRCGRTLGKNDCRLFDFKSSLVSRDDYVSAIASESDWFNIYSLEIDNPASYGICRQRYDSPSVDGEFVQMEQCFNRVENMCEDFTLTVRLEEDECGRVKVQGVNASVDEMIYSQDLSQYFWRDICEGRIDEENCGNGRYIDLNVKFSRIVETDEKRNQTTNDDNTTTITITEGTRVPDLTSLPWDLISADLKNIYGRDFSDPEMRYVFIGEECEI